MERFPDMTSKVTMVVRATGIEDSGRVSDAGRNAALAYRKRQPRSRISVVSDQGPIPTPDPAPMCARPACGNIVGMIEVCKLPQLIRRDVFVRSPRRSGLTKVLTCMGATVLAEPGHGLSVTGMDACRIASVAAAHYIPIQELTPRRVRG